MSGISQDDFVNTIRTSLGASAIPTVSSPTNAPSNGASTPVQARTPSPNTPAPTSAELPAAPAAALREQHIPVSPILPPSSKAKGKQKVNPPDSRINRDSKAAQAARDALRKKKQEEKEELARIQARIEADKAERKAQAEARKAERERERQSTPTNASPALNSTSIKGSQAKEVHLNIRLFDGRTIRSTFPRTAKLQDDVRPWIDSEFVAMAENPREEHPPYFFKQIMAPLPSRELSAGEENQTLGDIDLAPSATLVLIPVKGHAEAYSGGGGGVVGGVVGGVSGLIGGVFGLAYNAAGYVGSTVGSVVGYGTADEGSADHAPAQSSTREASERRLGTPSDPGVRVRTLADQREREPRNQELYNGNQVRPTLINRHVTGRLHALICCLLLTLSAVEL